MMARPLYRVLFVGLSLPMVFAGCKDGGSDASPTAKSDGPGQDEARSDGDAEACDDAHREALQKELSSHCRFSDKQPRVDVPLAPFDATPAAVPNAERIEVRDGEVRIGWGEATSVEDLVEHLVMAKEMTHVRGEPFQGWVLAIASDVPTTQVSAVLRALHAGGHREGRLVLAVAPSDPVPGPRDPKRLQALAAEVTDLDPSARATAIAKTISEAMPPCPAMIEAFSAVAMVQPADRCSVLARGLSKGLVSCGCPKEDDIVTLVYGINVGLTPPTRLTALIETTLDPDAVPRTGSTWGEVVAGLDPDAMAHLWLP
jgi:hypothetical protein